MGLIEKAANMAVGAVIALYIVGEIGVVFLLVSIPVIAAIEAITKEI